MNSGDELADRADNTRMPAIVQQAENIILNGTIDETIGINFNAYQLKEEKEKITLLEADPNKSEHLFELEDNPLLYGQISIIGLKHIDLADSFNTLTMCDYDKVDCALMTIGNYSQLARNGWRYQFGSSKMNVAWNELFHKSANTGFEKTNEILIELLNRHTTFDNEKLDKIIGQYLSDCEGKSHFPWRYYYIKYPIFRPGRFGKMAMIPDHYEEYMLTVMMTNYQLSESSYMPYLKEVDPKHLNEEKKGQRLTYSDRYIICRNDGFVVKNNDDDSVIEKIIIKQDTNGIDTENRIEVLKDYIKKNNLQ